MPKEDEILDDDQEEIIDNDGVETTDSVEDEANDEDDDTTDEEDDDSQEEEGDDEDTGDGEDDEPEFKKAFSQIKGDTPQEYAQNLEEAYRQSSQEGKLNAKKAKEAEARIDQIAAAVAKNPELAKLINEAVPDGEISPTTDPALLHARQAMEQKMESDYKAFTDLHPELDSDPDLQEKVLAEVTIFGDAARKKGKILGMDDALRKAWISLGLDKEDSKEKVSVKAKETASKSKTNNSNKKTTKTPTLTPEQIAAGKKMGLTEKQMLTALK